MPFTSAWERRSSTGASRHASSFTCGFALAFLTVSAKRDEPFGGVGAAVEEDVFDELQELLRDFLVNGEHPRIDDAHVEPGADGVVKKGGVHRFADGVVAAEGKRDVCDAAADAGAREVRLDPARGLDEVDRVVVVLLEAGGDGEDVRIENDVLRRESRLVRSRFVGAGANFDAALRVVGLAFFVERHDDGGGAVAADERGALADEFLFAVFQADAS